MGLIHMLDGTKGEESKCKSICKGFDLWLTARTRIVNNHLKARTKVHHFYSMVKLRRIHMYTWSKQGKKGGVIPQVA